MLRVLIVEDEDIIRKGIAYTVDWMSMGCVIAGEASNGKEGVEKIFKLKPDIVLSDIMMPYFNGLEMIRQAKGSVNFKSILLTSHAEFSYARQAIDLQVSDYLIKPVEAEVLKATIAKVSAQIEKDRVVEKMYEKKYCGIDMDEYYVRAKQENYYISKTLNITRARYMEKLSVECIAEELGVSASYLSRKFKNTTGLTYLDFLNKYRVQQSIKMLETGIYKVYEVSDMTGFTDYKHFNSVFKRYTNQSPSEFIG